MKAVDFAMDVKETTNGIWSGHSFRHYWLQLKFDDAWRLIKRHEETQVRAQGPNCWLYQQQRLLREVEIERILHFLLSKTKREARQEYN